MRFIPALWSAIGAQTAVILGVFLALPKVVGSGWFWVLLALAVVVQIWAVHFARQAARAYRTT